MDLTESFKNFFTDAGIPGNARLLVAVSGGVDSVVLCDLCHKSGFDFAIAHCNFQLRDEESGRDENFVNQLGLKYGVEVFVKKLETSAYANEKRLSIQEAARNLRYEWFDRLRKENNFNYTVLAHHADDNIETLLMNFFRGTGLQGLKGMPSFELSGRCILRPLLNSRRLEILSYANDHNIAWVEDSSNTSAKYTRNFFRHQLLPLLSKAYPEVDKNLLNNIKRFNNIGSIYHQSITELKKKFSGKVGDEIRIAVKKLVNYNNPALVYELIKDFGFGEKQVDELIKLADADSGRFIKNENYQIIKHGRWFIIAPLSGERTTLNIEEGEERIHAPAFSLQIQCRKADGFQIKHSNETAQLDAALIEFPLVLRKWKQGDYFYPLGMRKKKKLSRFFIDSKLPKNQKENKWVIESKKKIIWIVGMRIDDRFKITANTKNIMLIISTSPSPSGNTERRR